MKSIGELLGLYAYYSVTRLKQCHERCDRVETFQNVVPAVRLIINSSAMNLQLVLCRLQTLTTEVPSRS